MVLDRDSLVPLKHKRFAGVVSSVCELPQKFVAFLRGKERRLELAENRRWYG